MEPGKVDDVIYALQLARDKAIKITRTLALDRARHRDAIEAWPLVAEDEIRYVWPTIRDHLSRCGVLIGPSGIEIRPTTPGRRRRHGHHRAAAQQHHDHRREPHRDPGDFPHVPPIDDRACVWSGGTVPARPCHLKPWHTGRSHRNLACVFRCCCRRGYLRLAHEHAVDPWLPRTFEERHARRSLAEARRRLSGTSCG
jgi:hypothetical protein